MANLRGGTFEKQVKDAFFKTLAYGVGRNMKDDNLTHSVGLGDKRMGYLNDFKNFIIEKGIQEGKLNMMMDEKNIREFIEKRTDNLSPKSALDYTSGFNSLLKGLEQKNIDIPSNPTNNDFLKDFREVFRKEMKELEFEKGRYIQNVEQKLEELKNIDYNSYVVAKLQNETGLRVSEAMEVVKNFDKYYKPNTNKLENVVGKGNHMYAPKSISNNLAMKIKKMNNVPSYSSYRENLKNVGIDRSHNFRVTFAKNSLEYKLQKGIEYKTALRETSEEINHHRKNMTEYYLARA